MAALDSGAAGRMDETGIPSVVQEIDRHPRVQELNVYSVLQFLKENKYSVAEQSLLREANLIKNEEKSQESIQADMSKTLAALKSESNPSLYVDSYASMKSFIDSCLDAHRCELELLLYPVFVQLYLELVFNSHDSEALEFFQKYSEDHLDLYNDYIRRLSLITKREHFQESQFFVDTFRTNMFNVRMSRDAHMQLKRFLSDNSKFPHLTRVLQEFISIEPYDGSLRRKRQIDLVTGAAAGEAHKDANKAKILLGLFKEPEITIPVEEDDEADDDKDKPKKKKLKKDPLLTRKTKSDPNAPPAGRVPLPEPKDADKLERINAYKEAAKRYKVGAAHVAPPICFHTVLNSFGGVTASCFSEDATLLAVGFQDSGIRVWSLTKQKLRAMKTGDELNEVDKEADDVLDRMMDDKTATEWKSFVGHSGPIYALSFSPDKQYLLSCSEDGTIRLWSLLTWTNLVCYRNSDSPVWDVQFAPHGHYFASGGFDRLARLWSTEHSQPLRTFAGHLSDVTCVKVHPNANYLATASDDRTVRLWDVHNGACVRIMTGHKGDINCLLFSPEGRHLVSAGADTMVNLWDLNSATILSQMKGHTDAVYALTFSREGSALVSGGLDNCIKFWDLSALQDENENTDNSSGSASQPHELISAPEYASFSTKSTAIYALAFMRCNVLTAVGPFRSWTG